jgi:SAM-dependent methyltransferase
MNIEMAVDLEQLVGSVMIEPTVPGRLPELPLRLVLTRFLAGRGIEIGPGHQPLALPFGGAEVRYVDRWEPDESRDLFPELGDGATFPEPDIVANLDTEGLGMLASESEDFVIASHLLEHLADPLGQLAEMHRVLKPGGVLLVLLPDRRHTFDRTRPPTPLDHLVEDHASGMRSVSDAHVEEFLRHTGGWDERFDDHADDEGRAAYFDRHRQRSIHVHCWTEHEFLDVLYHAVTAMDMRWELLDALLVEDVWGGFEFGYALRRCEWPSPSPLGVGARMRATYCALWERSFRTVTHPAA